MPYSTLILLGFLFFSVVIGGIEVNFNGLQIYLYICFGLVLLLLQTVFSSLCDWYKGLTRSPRDVYSVRIPSE